ncbi:MAG: hypothetical protein KKB51_18180 [Candidatus Riflebacteria bacterium]|nr:hypothetical protein [Candidatus Riflebacteria bacterium]
MAGRSCIGLVLVIAFPIRIGTGVGALERQAVNVPALDERHLSAQIQAPVGSQHEGLDRRGGTGRSDQVERT